MSNDWLWMTAADLGRGIGAGTIDPVDLTTTYLEAIAAHALRDRIYARVTADRAMAEARAARDRAGAGLRRGPLDGVPISWKDLYDTAGVATEAGTALLKDRVPDADARVLAAATRAGLVCLGKTHMTELAFSGLGLNPVTASPPCVNDADAVSGGSSSGAATSVAFGLAAAGIGSDTGGSVRVPSAWNDLVGLKTTHGRLSLDGVVPLCLKFDTVGPLCRSVEDAALLLAAMEDGAAPDLSDADLAQARFLVLETAAHDDIREDPAQAFAAATARIAATGAQITRAPIPEVAEALDLSGKLFAPEGYGLWQHLIEATPDLMYHEVLNRFRTGATVSAPDYVAAWRDLEGYRAAFNKAIAGYDAVLLPTAPILPPNMARLMQDSAYFVTENLMALRNTRIGNLMGSAALTLPTGTPSCGITLLGAPMSEARLLRVGTAVEAALA